MRVTLKDDDWSKVLKDSPVGKAIKNGDPLPLKGIEYEVSGYSRDTQNRKGYELSLFKGLLFKEERFEVTNTDFIPDSIINGHEVKRMQMYYSFEFPMTKEKLPRKKKKHLKKYGMTFTHPGHDITKLIK